MCRFSSMNLKERLRQKKWSIPRKSPGLTVGRAAMLVLMRRYLAAVMDPFVTLLEIHKLMYFMQEAGEGLKLQYNKALYGPYAQNLRHVLTLMEGHFISGYGDAEDNPERQINLLPDDSSYRQSVFLKIILPPGTTFKRSWILFPALKHLSAWSCCQLSTGSQPAKTPQQRTCRQQNLWLERPKARCSRRNTSDSHGTFLNAKNGSNIPSRHDHHQPLLVPPPAARPRLSQRPARGGKVLQAHRRLLPQLHLRAGGRRDRRHPQGADRLQQRTGCGRRGRLQACPRDGAQGALERGAPRGGGAAAPRSLPPAA